MQGARQGAVAHRLHHLDDPADAGSGDGVADVGLQRAQQQGTFGVPVPAVGGQQRPRLDRVPEPGTGAMRLHRVHLAGGEARVRQRGADDALLGGTVRRRQPVGRPVLVHGGAAHHGEYPVPVAAGVGEPFDDEQADALRPGGAVGRRRERLDPPVGRQTALAAEVDKATGRAGDGDAAGQRQLGLAAPHRVDGQVEGDQGRGAGGVHRERRALKAEGVGDAAGGDAAELAGHQIALKLLGPRKAEIALLDHAGEDAGARAAQRRRVDPGVLQRLPGGLQQQPLLGVHRQRLAGGDAEEVGVEERRPFQESGLPGVGGAEVVGVRVVERVQVPAAVLGERADPVPALGDQPPQVVG
ncbi:hypothetical protein GCM10022227_05840 [Streptomyces sedi]